MPENTNPGMKDYGIRQLVACFLAVLGTSAMLLVRNALEQEWGAANRYLLYYPIVFLVAWLGGWAPAALAIALSALATIYLFVEPTRSLSIENLGDMAALVTFLMLSALMVGLMESLVRAKQRAERIAEQASFQSRELEREMGERRRIEEALRQSNQRFEIAAAAANGFVFEHDVATNTVYYSSGIFRILGYPKQDAGGSPDWWVEQIHPEDRQAVSEAYASVFENRRDYSLNYRARRKDGEWVYLSESGMIIASMEGTPERVIGSIIDVTDQKRAEEALHQSEERFRSLITATTQIIWTMSPSGEFTTEQPGWSSFTGQSFDELKGSGWLNAVHPEDHESTAANWKKALEQSHPFEFEHRLLRQDGSYRYMLMRAVPVLEKDASVREWVGVHTDVSERRKAEQALHESEARKSAILGTALDCIITTDHRGTVLEFNPSAEKTFGYDRDEAVGRELPELILPPSRREQYWQEITKYLSTGRARLFDKRLEQIACRSGGEEFPIELSIRPIETRGTPIFTWFIRDITDRKNAESGLRRTQEELETRVRERTAALARTNEALISEVSERKFAEEKLRENQRFVQAITDTTPAILYVYDIVLQKNVYVNPQADAVLGYNRSQTMRTGLLSQSVLHPEDYKAVHDWIEAIRNRQGDDQFEAVIRVRHSSLGWRWLQMRTAIFARDANGLPFQIVGTAIDVTSRRQAEDEVRRLNAELEQRVIERTEELRAANAELEAFSYSVSHDLRAPLRAIDGFSAMIVNEFKSQLPGEAHRLLDVIRNNTRQMGELVDDLLAFSRLGRQQVSKRSVNTGEVVSEVLLIEKQNPAANRVEFRVEPLPEIEADPILIKQVFANLVSNAVKFSGRSENPVVEIGSFSRDSEQIFYVKDNGVGFDSKYAHKLFGVFKRLHRAEEYEGTGVGLAIVHKIVSRHGGRIWAESEKNEGATFYFTLGPSDPRQDEVAPDACTLTHM